LVRKRGGPKQFASLGNKFRGKRRHIVGKKGNRRTKGPTCLALNWKKRRKGRWKGKEKRTTKHPGQIKRPNIRPQGGEKRGLVIGHRAGGFPHPPGTKKNQKGKKEGAKNHVEKKRGEGVAKT